LHQSIVFLAIIGRLCTLSKEFILEPTNVIDMGETIERKDFKKKKLFKLEDPSAVKQLPMVNAIHRASDQKTPQKNSKIEPCIGKTKLESINRSSNNSEFPNRPESASKHKLLKRVASKSKKEKSKKKKTAIDDIFNGF